MKKGHSKNILIIDIGSASVGAALMRTEGDEVVLERVTRQAISAGSEEARGALEKRTQEALDLALKQYAGEFLRVHVVVAAPWHTSTVRTVKSKMEKSSSISMSTIERLIEKYKNEKPPVSGNVDIEAAALQVQVNGYPTALHTAVTGTEIAVNLYESEMSEQLHRAFSETIQKHIQFNKIAFYTFPLIASAASRMITNEASFVFVDISGEVTEIGIVHKDALQFLASIPSGYWTLLRSMESKSIGDARSRATLWAKNQLTPEESAALEESFGKAFTMWLKEFEETLKEAASTVPIPRTVFLLSDTEPALWVEKALQTFGTLGISPSIITPASIQRFVKIGESGSFDVFLALEAIFFHMSAEEVIGEPMPAKVV